MPNFIGLRHVGWGVKDPAALAAFYRDVLGMTVVTEFPAGTPPLGATVFLARHPDQHEHHDLVFFSNEVFAHTAFEVASLGELLASYREVKEKVPIDFTFNHGFWLSFYFTDPDGHRLEFFWRTGVWVPNDYQVMPVDLDRPEDEVMHDVELLREHFAGGTRTSAAEWNATHGGGAGQQNTGDWNPGQGNPDGWNPGQQNAGGEKIMSLTGTWNLSIETPVGTQSVVLELTENKGTFEGIAKGNGESMPLLDPALDGNRLTWKQSITRPIQLNLTFEVFIDGDTLTGTAKAGTMPPSKVTGTRVV